MAPQQPVRVAIVDDYDVIVRGTAGILEPFADLVQVVELSTDGTVDEQVDVALLDCFGAAEAHAGIVDVVERHPNVGKVAVYTWNFAPGLLEAAWAQGASSYLSKGLPGRVLADALVATHAGQRVVAGGEAKAGARPEVGRRWPGHDLGLTEREADVLAHITQGLTTAEIATALYLSVNSIKTYTRLLYRKIGVRSRTEAALWGIDHGFRPDRSSREDWVS